MKINHVLISLIAISLIVSACSNPAGSTGTLKGSVTIGPLIPVEQAGVTPVAPPADAFTSRGIEILKGGQEEVYKSLRFSADGSYSVSLPEGNYIVRLLSDSIDSAQGMPTSVKITAGNTTVLNITIDTGIR